METALFTTDGAYFWPANSCAARQCHIMSKMKLRESDMIVLRGKGLTPKLMDGTDIGRVNVTA